MRAWGDLSTAQQEGAGRSLEEEDLLPTGKVVRAVGKLCSQRGLEEAVISGIFRDYSGKVADSAQKEPS